MLRGVRLRTRGEDSCIHRAAIGWTLAALVYALGLRMLHVGPFFLVPTALFFFLVPVVLLVLVARGAGAHKLYSPREPRYRLPPTKPGPRKPSLRGPW